MMKLNIGTVVIPGCFFGCNAKNAAISVL